MCCYNNQLFAFASACLFASVEQGTEVNSTVHAAHKVLVQTPFAHCHHHK